MSLFGAVRTAARSTPAIGRIGHANFFAITSSSNNIVNNPTPQTTSIRSKHSATQVKRLFKNNPARLQTRGGAPTADKSSSSTPERVYPEIFQPTFLSNGWSAPPPPEVEIQSIHSVSLGRQGSQIMQWVFYPSTEMSGCTVQSGRHSFGVFRVTSRVSFGITRWHFDIRVDGEAWWGRSWEGSECAESDSYPYRWAIEVNGDRAKEIKKWLAGLGF
ncbi:hypothetical protein QTG54_011967 [Skeletonema marinoi]|uniref:Uncharacterized protein n=1 Tax=Skeletonema marinoi TaxID=267567 RepID=A0AAD9D8U4_9STRA|nr:hypothetical protein QTG54_011967 [Skeletonema marinoi]